MTLSELIKQAQALLEAEGDLDVVDRQYREVTSVALFVSHGNFPESWNMPAGDKIARIKSFD